MCSIYSSVTVIQFCSERLREVVELSFGQCVEKDSRHPVMASSPLELWWVSLGEKAAQEGRLGSERESCFVGGIAMFMRWQGKGQLPSDPSLGFLLSNVNLTGPAPQAPTKSWFPSSYNSAFD